MPAEAAVHTCARCRNLGRWRPSSPLWSSRRRPAAAQVTWAIASAIASRLAQRCNSSRSMGFRRADRRRRRTSGRPAPRCAPQSPPRAGGRAGRPSGCVIPSSCCSIRSTPSSLSKISSRRRLASTNPNRVTRAGTAHTSDGAWKCAAAADDARARRQDHPAGRRGGPARQAQLDPSRQSRADPQRANPVEHAHRGSISCPREQPDPHRARARRGLQQVQVRGSSAGRRQHADPSSSASIPRSSSVPRSSPRRTWARCSAAPPTPRTPG